MRQVGEVIIDGEGKYKEGEYDKTSKEKEEQGDMGEKMRRNRLKEEKMKLRGKISGAIWWSQ